MRHEVASLWPGPTRRLAKRRKQIEVFHLPTYSPELNPCEGLHADLKEAVTDKLLARSRPELKRRVINWSGPHFDRTRGATVRA